MAELEAADCCSEEVLAECCEPVDKEECCTRGASSCGCDAGAVGRTGIEIRETYRLHRHAGAPIIRAVKPRGSGR